MRTERGTRNEELRRRTLQLAAAFAFLLGTPAAAAAQDLGIAVGAQGPVAMLEGVDGTPVDLAAYVGKKPVLIEFWATWCPNCRELEPAMHAAHAKFHDRVAFVGIAVPMNQSPERVRLYAEKHKLPMAILYDRDGAAIDAYEVPATSYVVVLDAAGKVVYTGLGGEQDLEGAIERALKK